MGKISSYDMRKYLTKSISSMNKNKLNGLLAEIDFRNYVENIGFKDRVSSGGWIARCEGAGNFSHDVVAFFPETMEVNANYDANSHSEPPYGLHTICSTLHQIGIHSYYCMPIIGEDNDLDSIGWCYVQLGVPTQQQYMLFPENINGFNRRSKKYNFLRYKTDVSSIPEIALSHEFSKENLRIAFQNVYLSEISDIDGILWGNQFTYPIEIKEKTAAKGDKHLGDYFGLDVGPFVKLAFYAAKKGNLHSLYIVREIDDVENRNLINWWCITFERMAQFASWVFREGGKNMQGGRSATVRIPKSEFEVLDARFFNKL